MESAQTPSPAKDRPPTVPTALEAFRLGQRMSFASILLLHAESLERQMRAWAEEYKLEVEKLRKGARFLLFLYRQLGTLECLSPDLAIEIEPLGTDFRGLILALQLALDEVISPNIRHLSAMLATATADESMELKRQDLFLEAAERLRIEIAACREREAHLNKHLEFGT